MKVEKIDHLHAYAKDVDAVCRLFTDLFGMKCRTMEFKEFGSRTCVVSAGKTFIEFLQPTDPKGRVAKLVGSRPEGLLCVNFKVPNIDEGIAELESRGIKLTQRFDIGPIKQAWFDYSKTFGVQVELGEYPGDDIGKLAAQVIPK